jgi:putative ABC transport system permease protein
VIKNYIKIAWRSLTRNKGFSLINILGLTIGITSAILISLWVRDELTFDKQQKNYNSIYQVIANRNFNNQVFTDRNMAFALQGGLENGFPQIKNSVITTGVGGLFKYGDKKLTKNGLAVSAHFFDIFSCDFLKGDPRTALATERGLVLTQSMAKAFFGNEDPINKILMLSDSSSSKVSAVIADQPANSSFSFDYLEPYSAEFIRNNGSEWQNSFSAVYIQVNPGVDTRSLDKNITSLIQQHVPNDHVSTYFTFPMSKWHLEGDFKDGVSTGDMREYVNLFSIIAIIILVIACVNFMNLSTSRSERKAKEVGVRKTLGSTKKQLIAQFISESILITFFAYAISIIAVLLLLPSFNLLVGKQLSLNFSEPLFWIGSLIIILFTGFFSGSYPALYLSSFNPVKVLKGTMLVGGKAALPRRVLVTSQFIVSILLISATIIVYQQIQYLKNRPKGYNDENLLIVASSSELSRNFNVVKQEILKSRYANAVTRTSSPVTEVYWNFPAPDWEGKSRTGDLIISGLMADVDLTKTIQLKIISGRDFTGEPSDRTSVIVNKTAVRDMGLKDPIGTKIQNGKNYTTIIGVVDDMIMESPFKPVKPLFIYYNDNDLSCINIRLNASIPIKESLEALRKIFEKHNPAYPFEYQFMNEAYDQKFVAEELVETLSNIFAGLAIFICCIGLVGLTAFTIEKRIREIGVRRILGATLMQLARLISNEFLKLVFIAFVVAIPLTWFLMDQWLRNYSFHIAINIWVFVIVGVSLMALTFLIVLLNTLKAAKRNPVKNLRTE